MFLVFLLPVQCFLQHMTPLQLLHLPKTFQILLKTMNDVGPSNVIQVIIDNATNCKGAGKIIEQVHPHIFWSGCLVHTLNLLMHDIVKHRECG
jgi:hypothetical protein